MELSLFLLPISIIEALLLCDLPPISLLSLLLLMLDPNPRAELS